MALIPGCLAVLPVEFFVLCTLGAACVAGMTFATRVLLAKDRFLRKVYDRYPALWEQMGRPHGWLFRAELTHLVKDARGAKRTVDWSLWGRSEDPDPEWLNGFPDVVNEYIEARRLAALWNWRVFPVLALLLTGCSILLIVCTRP